MTKSVFMQALTRHRDRIYGFAYYLLRDRAEAEDVTQEAYLRMWHRWDGAGGNRKQLPWLLRVTHNLCIDALRRRRSVATGVPSALDPDTLPAPADSRLDPQLRCQLDQDQQALLGALETLSARSRAMLLLHYFQGLDYRAVGEVLEMKTSAVKVAVHRARKSLRTILAERFPERARRVSNG
jgi:RNA polymerase sigma-70 factor (ECF subfamily)